jgi:hypothetical protein
MRSIVVFLILGICIFTAAQSQEITTSWSGAHTLYMSKIQPTIDLKLSTKIASMNPDETLPVFVFFTDKGIADQDAYQAALSQAESALTPAARARRMKSRGAQNLVDFRDLQVYEPYVQQVLSQSTTLRQTLKWFNAISVNATPAQVQAIASWANVRLVKAVAASKGDTDLDLAPIVPDLELSTLDYGQSAGQLNQIDVIPAHELGFKGQGVLVAMFDVGYKQSHDAFQNIINSNRLIAQYDFINHDNNTDYDPEQDGPSQADHGTLTWSTLGGEASGHLYGPSYMSNFILAKTENVSSERHIEEDNWAAAGQWADSIGASVISSSLGYGVFDAGEGDYQYSDFDGNTTIVTQAADLAAYNGIAVCNAMGNQGPDAGSITAPADADSIISCGAVDNSGILANFSGRGPTADNRIKPEVCAQGSGTACADPDNMNGYTQASGTSLSTPLVGGVSGILFSAHPNWTNMMVREALMMTADRYSSPDNDYGSGILDLTRAMYYHPAGDIVFDCRPLITAAAGQPINITANITGGSGIAAAQVYWRNGDTGEFTPITMSSAGSDYSTAIPAQTGSQVQYYLRAMDTNNSVAYFPLGGEMHPLKLGLDAIQYIESFDDGINSWISGGTNNTWCLSAKYARTGTLSLTDSPSGNYLNNTDSWIKSNFALDLSHAASANFSFYWRGVLQTNRDTLFVEASSDDSTWNRFASFISGSGFSFAQISCDLAPYLGQNDVRIRFHLTTDGSTAREGIYIDDLVISWTPTAITDEPITTPRIFSLNQNYPNPFNPSTRIEFSLVSREHVELSIYDLLGRKIRTLFDAELEPGSHAAIWDGAIANGQDAASGVYLYKLSAGDSSDIRRMTLVR